MFVQVVRAPVADEDAILAAIDRWQREVRPAAEGFLGSTAGVTKDGQFVVVARFEDEQAARRNSERPEQDAWWAETQKALSDVEFKDSVKVVLMGGGGSNDAGFVQVMRGRILDEDKMSEMEARMREFEDAMSNHRPDVIGDVNAVHADGTFSDAIYFTSEEAAREGEKKDPPPELAAIFEDFMAAGTIDEYIDLREPRLR